MKRHIVVYTGGPITAATPAQHKKFIDTAWDAAAWLLQHGFAVHSPHLNTQYMDGLLSHEEFLSQDFAILERCDYFALLPGWRNSKGTRRELAFAVRHGIPVWELQRIDQESNTWNMKPLELSMAESRELGLLIDVLREEG